VWGGGFRVTYPHKRIRQWRVCVCVCVCVCTHRSHVGCTVTHLKHEPVLCRWDSGPHESPVFAVCVVCVCVFVCVCMRQFLCLFIYLYTFHLFSCVKHADEINITRASSCLWRSRSHARQAARCVMGGQSEHAMAMASAGNEAGLDRRSPGNAFMRRTCFLKRKRSGGIETDSNLHFGVLM